MAETIPRTTRHVRLIAEAFSAFNRDNASRFGAALAFYIALSIAPIAVVAIAIAGLIFVSDAAEGTIFHQIAGTLGPATGSALAEMVKTAARPRVGFIASALGLATLAYGLYGIYEQIDDALRSIWKVQRADNESLLVQAIGRIRAVGLVLGVGLILFVIVSADAAIAITGKYAANHLLGGEVLWHAIQLVVSSAVLTALFAIMFRYVPIVLVKWRDVLPGAVSTALLFVLGKFALGIYLGKAAVGSSYGAAGCLVVVLIWAYWSAQIFFFGLEVTHVFAMQDPGLSPAIGGRAVPAHASRASGGQVERGVLSRR